MSENWHDAVTPVLRRLQLIVAAIVVGCLMFLAISFFVASPPDGNRQPLITYVALAFAALAMVSRIVLVGVVVAVGRRAIARGLPPSPRGTARASPDNSSPSELACKLWGLYTTRTICGAAILEGAAFFLAVAYLLEGFWPAPAGAALLIVGLLLHIPTRAAILHWTEVQLRLLEEERQMGS